MTPRGSPKQEVVPLIPQTTGEWHGAFPSFRQSLLGGKSLNRFSSFVTSGAEEWVLKGSVVETTISSPKHERETSDDSDVDETDNYGLLNLGTSEANQHFVESGPAWKAKLPPFRVLVHSPSKCTSTLSGAFTIYSVTSLFHSHSISDSSIDGNHGSESPTRVTVHRRFSHFVMLHTALIRRLPGIALPPLPEKQYAGRFSADFVEARRGDLERYIGRVVRHPVARYAEIVTLFLGCDNDIVSLFSVISESFIDPDGLSSRVKEFRRMVPRHLSLPPAGSSFYAQVFHPAFNLDTEEATGVVEKFDTHTKAVGKGVQGLRNVFGQVREARIGEEHYIFCHRMSPLTSFNSKEMSKADRLLSYSLLSLITSKPLASVPTAGVNEEDELHSVKRKGLLNEEGAWCWREGCESECLIYGKIPLSHHLINSLYRQVVSS